MVKEGSNYMATYQYLRVSTTKQETGRQELIQKKYKIDKTFEDKASGKSTENRPALKELMNTVKAGDIVVASELSRLGRSLKDCINIFEDLIEKGVQVIADKEGIDSNSSTYKLLLGIFGAVAEMEREQTVERINQSAEYYKEHGVTTKGKTQWGRAKKTVDELPKNFKKYYLQMKSGEINKSEMAKLLGITRQGLYKWLKLYEEENKESTVGLAEEPTILFDENEAVEVQQKKLNIDIKESDQTKEEIKFNAKKYVKLKKK